MRPGFVILWLLTFWWVTAGRAEEPPDSHATPGDAAPPRDEDLAFFEKRIRPLLSEHCLECHASTSQPLRGGLMLDSRQAILAGGDSGPAAVPGEPDRSRIIEAVRFGDTLQMPPKGQLPADAVEQLAEWVRRGLPFPAASEPARSSKGIDIEQGRSHWSFQPVRAHPLPETPPHLAPQRRFDAFIHERLQRAELQPSPAASRRVLLRRLKFDLLGLPPTPDEVLAFETDTAPDALDRWTDRYLASPHYGERWARYWLDLARYCDVPESWHPGQGQAWLYRDWVVRAFNTDLPYDDFIRRQLAADLLPEADPEDHAALGFLGLSPTYWKELKLDPKVIRQVVAEEYEEHVEALGGTFLGLTLACARCHDHKFDPITTQDYYGLAGVLASIQFTDRSILPPERAQAAQQAREQIAAWQQQIDALQKQKPPPEDAPQQLQDLQARIRKLQEETPDSQIPLAYGVREASLHVLPDGPHRTKLEYRPDVPQDLAVHIRGNPNNPGEIVPRRFPQVLSGPTSQPFTHGSGRADLAEALVTDAGALTARVYVNRIWQYHFGRGIVNTPSNFGVQGDPPSHPELLDDLSHAFQTHGWSTKWLHRELLLSNTYQQASTRSEDSFARDPENVWLWRFAPRRLDVEAWRDAMLAVSGVLDAALGGPSLELAGGPPNHRRTLYARIKRRELSEMLRLHDFPDPVGHAAAREPTTSPLQQLFVLNSPLLYDQSRHWSERLQREAGQDETARIRLAYALAFARQPLERELQWGREFIQTTVSAGTSLEEAWQQYLQMLLGSNELLFVD